MRKMKRITWLEMLMLVMTMVRCQTARSSSSPLAEMEISPPLWWGEGEGERTVR